MIKFTFVGGDEVRNPKSPGERMCTGNPYSKNGKLSLRMTKSFGKRITVLLVQRISDFTII